MCLCGGCASCGHAACQNLARLAYRSGGKNALCLPCAEHVLLALAAQQGIELGIAGAGEDLLKAHLQDAAGVELCGERAARCHALRCAFLGHITAAICQPLRGNTFSAHGSIPFYIMVRESSSHEWSLRRFAYFWYNHCSVGRRSAFTLDADLTAGNLQQLGLVFNLPYAGVWEHCHGDVASFAAVPQEVPHYPAFLPVRERGTYWSFACEGRERDLIIAPLDHLLRSLVACFEGQQGLVDVASWLSTLSRSSRLCMEGDLGRIPFLHTWATFLQASEQEWMARPPLLARPVMLSDYITLGARLGSPYRGILRGERTLLPAATPSTVFSTVALFGPKPLDDCSSWECFLESCVRTGYLRGYLQWQGRVPTFARMREALDRLGDADEDHASVLTRIREEFPQAPPSLVETVCLEVLHARGRSDWFPPYSSEAL